MAANTNLLPFFCVMNLGWMARNNKDSRAVMDEACKVVKDGGGIMKGYLRDWPGLVYWIAPNQKNPLLPIPEQFKADINKIQVYQIYKEDEMALWPQKITMKSTGEETTVLVGPTPWSGVGGT